MSTEVKNEVMGQGAHEVADVKVEINTTTIDVSDVSGEVKLANAMVGTANGRISDIIDEKLHMVDYLVHTKGYEDEETGEIKAGVRVLIYDSEGFSYVTSSPVVAENLAVFVAQFGIERFRSGEVQIVVRENKSANGRKYHTVELAV